MFATPDQIIASVVKCFNQRSDQMGFGSRSSANLPVLASDLSTPGARGGDSSVPVERCRHLCIYLIASHCVVENPFTKDHRPLSYGAIGSVFGVNRNAVAYAAKAACALMCTKVYAEVYQSALDGLNAQGLELWRAKFSRFSCT